MDQKRRDFLKMLSVGTCGALVHNCLEPFNGMISYALAQSAGAQLASDSVLVIVNLAGGCSYNIAGSYLGAYRDKFPDISYGPPGTARPSLAISSEQGIHPSLTALKTEFDAGNLALLNMVGLDGNPDFGHDSASEKWQRGMIGSGNQYGGWMARLTCQLGQSFGGISLGGTDTFTQGDCSPPPSLGDLSNFGEDSFWGGEYGTQWLQTKRTNVLRDAEAPINDSEKKITSSISSLESSLGTIRQYANASLPYTFPNTNFGRACRDAARLIIARPLGTRIIYLVQGGYDTHSNELTAHTNNFNELNGGLTPLIQTLKATGNYDRTVIATMSEFGRTFQNSNRGTDHGYASPMFLIGGKINGGIHTPSPQAGDLAGNYIRNRHCDPREAYYQIVSAMGLDANAIFPESFSKRGLQLLKA